MDDKITKLTEQYAAVLAGPAFPNGYYAVVALMALLPENEGYKLDFKQIKIEFDNRGFKATRKGNLVRAVYPSGDYVLTLFSYRNSNTLEVLFGEVTNESKSVGLATLARHLQLQGNPNEDPLYPRFEVESDEALQAVLNYVVQLTD